MHRLLGLSSPLLGLVLTSLIALSGCKAHLLPETSVPDTRENRAIVGFIECYRKAAESRSVDDIMELVATDFYDAAGTPKQDNNSGFTQLKERLTTHLSKIESLSLRFHIQNIEKKDDLIRVVYFFRERALIKYPSESQWYSADDVNRLDLRLKTKSYKDGFEIVSGL